MCTIKKLTRKNRTVKVRSHKVYFSRLRLIPTKLEQKAQIPECMMRIVVEEEHGHDGDGTEVNIVDLGQPMRIEWSLSPESGYSLPASLIIM